MNLSGNLSFMKELWLGGWLGVDRVLIASLTNETGYGKNIKG
jgi:hypothetical protein